MNKLNIRIYFKNVFDKFQDIKYAMSVTGIAFGLSEKDLYNILSGPL